MGLMFLWQKKGTKRRLKSRGNGSMGVASIPQITYEHIDDSEKKDTSYFMEEPREPNDGNAVTSSLTF